MWENRDIAVEINGSYKEEEEGLRWRRRCRESSFPTHTVVFEALENPRDYFQLISASGGIFYTLMIFKKMLFENSRKQYPRLWIVLCERIGVEQNLGVKDFHCLCVLKIINGSYTRICILKLIFLTFFSIMYIYLFYYMHSVMMFHF